MYNIWRQKEKAVGDLEGFNVRMVLLLLIREKRREDVLATESNSHSWWDWAYARKPSLLRLLLQRMT